MKTLILMRHTKSDWSISESDHNRVLNPRGIRSARALGDWLRGAGHVPDRALVSSARRTRESIGLLALDCPATFQRALYLAEPEVMLHQLRQASGDTVLMLGHNPGICALAHDLTADAPHHPRWHDFPTGATLVARFDVQGWSKVTTRTGQCVDFITPRDLTDG